MTMSITAQDVKKLRDITGAGMMDCKQALAQCAGDVEQAVDVLRTKGLADLAKKSGRATNEGIVGACLADDAQVGAIVEVDCETDFVARNEDFQGLVAEIAAHVCEAAPADLEALAAQKLTSDPAHTVEERLGEAVGKIGENIQIARFARFAIEGTSGLVTSYVHGPGNIGVLVQLSTGSADAASSEDAKTAAKDIAMQIAAASPSWVRREEVPADVVERERAIYVEQAAQTGKPENVVAKIVEGKLEKFYGQLCLVEQPFIRDDTMTVAKYLEGVAAKAGASVEVGRFARFRVGDESGG